MPTYRVETPVKGKASTTVDARDEAEARQRAAQTPLEDWEMDEWVPVITDQARMSVHREDDDDPPMPIRDVTPGPDFNE